MVLLQSQGERRQRGAQEARAMGPRGPDPSLVVGSRGALVAALWCFFVPIMLSTNFP